MSFQRLSATAQAVPAQKMKTFGTQVPFVEDVTIFSHRLLGTLEPRERPSAMTARTEAENTGAAKFGRANSSPRSFRFGGSLSRSRLFLTPTHASSTYRTGLLSLLRPFASARPQSSAEIVVFFKVCTSCGHREEQYDLSLHHCSSNCLSSVSAGSFVVLVDSNCEIDKRRGSLTESAPPTPPPEPAPLSPLTMTFCKEFVA